MNLNKLAMYVLLMFLLVSSVSAYGLAPAEKSIDYKPNSRENAQFRFINSEQNDLELTIVARGELAEYIELEKEKIYVNSHDSEVNINYVVNLPDDLEPGLRTADILVIPIPKDVQSGFDVSSDTKVEAVNMPVDRSQNKVMAMIALIHQTKVNVPYPGKYLKGILNVNDANVNEHIGFTISLFGLGDERIESAKATIIIKGPTNEEIAVIRTEETPLNVQEKTKLAASWKADVDPGRYYAEIIVEYDGKTLLLDKVFYVGDKRVEIEKIGVDNFRLGTIAKFDILLRSKWNEPISDVYAKMQVLDENNNLLTDFKTKSVDLQPLGSEDVEGYWDTQDVEPGEYDINVQVYYDDQVSEKLFETVVSFDSIDVRRAITGRAISGERKLSDSVLVIIVLILIGINIGWFVYYKRKK
jgi:hypothetical protein